MEARPRVVQVDQEAGSVSVVEEAWVRWILGILGGVILTTFGAMFRRLFHQQDELAKYKANEASVEKRFSELQQTIRDHAHEDRDMHRQIGQKLDSVVQQLGITNATIAGIAGRIESHLDQ